MSQNSPHFFSSFSNTATKRERQKNDFFYVIYKIKKMADNKCTTTTDKIAQNDKHNKLAQNENRELSRAKMRELVLNAFSLGKVLGAKLSPSIVRDFSRVCEKRLRLFFLS